MRAAPARAPRARLRARRRLARTPPLAVARRGGGQRGRGGRACTVGTRVGATEEGGGGGGVLGLGLGRARADGAAPRGLRCGCARGRGTAALPRRVRQVARSAGRGRVQRVREERWQVPGGVRRERSAPRPPSRGRRQEGATLSRCEAQLQAHAPFPDRAPIQRRGAGDGGKTLSSTGAEARATYGLWLVPECGCRRGRRDSQLRRASLAPRSTRAPDRSSVPERRCLLSNHLHTDCCASLYLCCARDFSAVHRLERSGALHMCDLLDLLHDL